MSDKTDLQGIEYLPIMTTAQAVERYNRLVEFVRAVMKKDVDFGVIPGTQKPTLLKPGAEKLCTLFGLAPECVLVRYTEDWERGFFNYHYATNLLRNSVLVARGEGSANSMEKKYRWRYVPEWSATDDEKERSVRQEKRKGKNDKMYTFYCLSNDDPFTLVNTLQKMAQKRSLIAATLLAVNASEFFTQDIEDMTIEGAWHEPEAVPVTTQHDKLVERYATLLQEAEALGIQGEPHEAFTADEDLTRAGVELRRAVDDIKKQRGAPA